MDWDCCRFRGTDEEDLFLAAVITVVSLGWRLPLFETAEDGPSLRQKTADELGGLLPRKV